jgi:hypothetical protein
MTHEEAKSLKPLESYVIFAESKYRFVGLYPESDIRHETFLMIYDEEPHNDHIDCIKIESCQLENKQGENTPEEYLNENGLDYNSLEMLLLRKEDISIALEMARKSEREKVISIIEEKLNELCSNEHLNNDVSIGKDRAYQNAIEILNNLKKRE